MDLFGTDIEEEIEPLEEETEEAAPADTFTAPRAMEFSFGHKAIEQNLIDLYNSGRMPHAFVFSGPQGIGKSTLAYRFARFLLKHGIKDTNQSSMFGDAPAVTNMDVKADDPVFRRLASGGHPDFFSAERKFDEAKGIYKDALDVDEIRKIAPFLRMTSSEGGWRVVIVDDADTMSRSAQNAILKILEEPPKNSVLILIAHRAGALLPTIRSRVRFINFAPLSDNTLKEMLQKSNPGLPSRDTDFLIKLSEGSFGKALQYAQANAPQTLKNLLQMLDNNSVLNWQDIHKFSETLSGPGSDQSYQTFQEILSWLLRQSARARARGEAPPADAALFLKNSSLEELLKICENLENHFIRSDIGNLDRRQTILGAFSLLQ